MAEHLRPKATEAFLGALRTSCQGLDNKSELPLASTLGSNKVNEGASL